MKFPEGQWVKNWVVNVGVVFASLDGYLYTKAFQDKLGKKFDNSIMTYKNGVSVNYLLKSEIDVFCKHFVEKIKSDITLAKKWYHELIAETDKINALTKEYSKKDELTLDEFITLKEVFYSHVAPNFGIKRVIDYLPPEILSQLIDDFEKARLYTESVYMDFEALLKRILDKIGADHNYPSSLIYCLTYLELEKYVQTGELQAKEILEERTDSLALWYQHGKQQIFTGQKATDLIDKITQQTAKKMIKGMTAYPGNVQGKVKIVFNPKDSADFQEGDILVTGMTRPEFIPIMKKASAFVTDSGGMLSHAAITAREMKKPCVVGTELATKILKNGDIVEIDAEKGLIKIIK